MASFATSSVETCRRCSLCYVSDTYSKSEFVSEIEADDATSTLRADTIPDDTVVLDGSVRRHRPDMGRRSTADNDSAEKKTGKPLHVFGHGLNVSRASDSDSLPVDDGHPDIGGEEVSRRTSVAASTPADEASETSSHSDDTSKGNNAMLYMCVPGYREIRRRDRLKKKAKITSCSSGGQR